MRHERFVLYALLFALIAINYANRVPISVGSAAISAEFQLSSVQLGFLFSSFLWTYVIFLIPWGYLADRVGPRRISLCGMAIWSAATILTSFTSSISTLFGARLLMGAGEASAFPAAGRLIREWVPASEYGLANMVMISGGYAGPAIGSFVFGWLASELGWRTGLLIVGCIGFVWIVVALRWFKKPNLGGVQTKRDLHATNDAQAGGYGIGTLLLSRSMWGLCLTQGACVYSHYLFLSWLPNYLQTTRHLTVMTTGLLSGIPFAVSVFTSLFFAWVSDRLLRGRRQTGQRRWMVGAMMILSATIVLLPLISNIGLIIALVTISLTGISTATGLNSALLSDLLQSPADAGKANGLFVVGGNIFGALAPIVTGYVVADTHSFDAAWWLCGALLVIGALIAITTTRKSIGSTDVSRPVPSLLIQP